MENSVSLDLKFVCRCGCGGKHWMVCEYVPICPHAYNKHDDFSFSVRCHEALCDIIDGKYRTKVDAARVHGIRIHEFKKYRIICGYLP